MAGAGYLLFTAGQVLTAAQVNTYLNQQSVMVFATTAARDAALTSVKSEGMVTYQLDNNDLDIYNGTTFSTLVGNAHGALTTWTPAVTQSVSVTTTNTYSRIQRVGRTIFGWFNLTVTGSGTAGQPVSFPPPATAANSNIPIGHGELFDTSASLKYPFSVFLSGVNTIDLRSVAIDGMVIDNREGVIGFTAGLAVNDTIGGYLMFESSTDA